MKEFNKYFGFNNKSALTTGTSGQSLNGSSKNTHDCTRVVCADARNCNDHVTHDVDEEFFMLRTLFSKPSSGATPDAKVAPILFIRLRNGDVMHDVRALLDSGASSTILNKDFADLAKVYTADSSHWNTAAGLISTTKGKNQNDAAGAFSFKNN